MQLYVASWKFESSEDQAFASQSIIDYFESGKANQFEDGYERIAWLHMPQDGTGIVICKAKNMSILYKVFIPWREKCGMIWEFKPALSSEELLLLLK